MKTRDAVKYAGGVVELCTLLNCTRDAIYKWGSNVPEQRQYELEVKTSGALQSDYTLHKQKGTPPCQ